MYLTIFPNFNDAFSNIFYCLDGLGGDWKAKVGESVSEGQTLLSTTFHSRHESFALQLVKSLIGINTRTSEGRLVSPVSGVLVGNGGFYSRYKRDYTALENPQVLEKKRSRYHDAGLFALAISTPEKTHISAISMYRPYIETIRANGSNFQSTFERVNYLDYLADWQGVLSDEARFLEQYICPCLPSDEFDLNA